MVMKFLLALNVCNSQKLDVQIIKRQKIIQAKISCYTVIDQATCIL